MNRREQSSESLSGDFAAIILLVAILASTVFTGLEVYSSYRRIERETQRELNRIERRFVATIAQSVWNLDLLQTSMQLELIASSDAIHDVELRSDVASLSYHSRHEHDHTLPSSTHTFDMVHVSTEGEFDIGTLEVSMLAPWELLRLQENLTIDALFEFAKIGLLMLAVYLASSYYLTRPLQRLRDAVDAIDPSDPWDTRHELEAIQAYRRNEIGSLGRAFSGLLERTQEEIQQREASQRQLTASVEEKELLVQEVHHRVKNNLQLVVSMLALQRRQHDGDSLDAVLASAQNRVYSMSLVHQLLHREQGLQKLDLREYLRTLVRELVVQSRRPVRTVVAGDTTPLSADLAVPLGLIVTELVLNAMKHAFPDTEEGKIEVHVAIKADTCRIAVSDNGIGFPAESEQVQIDSLGMRLVEALSEQIQAVVTREAGDGTTYRISFNLL